MNPPHPRRRHAARSVRPSATGPLVSFPLAFGALVVLGACSGTTYDPTFATSATTAVETTTTLPSGTATELLPVLRTEASSLSGVMIDEGDDGAVADRVTALWDAAKAEVGRTRPDLVPGFEQNIALVQKAVQFSRAADADKAAKNLEALVASFLGD